MDNEKKILRCFHCGNLTSHSLVFSDSGNLMFEEFPKDGGGYERHNERFDFLNYKCSTCESINLIGGFNYQYNGSNLFEYQRLYPQGPNIIPPDHHWSGNKSPVPEELSRIYEEIWFLKHQVPHAFGNQIRRCLEFICEE